MLAGDFSAFGIDWQRFSAIVVVIRLIKNAFIELLLLCRNLAQKSNRISNYLSLSVTHFLSVCFSSYLYQISQGNLKNWLSLAKWEVGLVVSHKFIDLPKAFIMNYDN